MAPTRSSLLLTLVSKISNIGLSEERKDMSEKSRGGFHFGNIGGSVNLSAGRDIVGGDQATTQIGFAGEDQKQQFHSEIEQLREALRTMKTEIEASVSLDQDKKDEAISEILQQVQALKEVKEKATEVAPGKAVPAKIAAEIEGALDRAGGIVDKLQSVAAKTG